MEKLNIFYMYWNDACSCHPEYQYRTLITTLTIGQLKEEMRKYADAQAEHGIDFDVEDFMKHCPNSVLSYDNIDFEPGEWAGEKLDIEEIVSKTSLYSPGKYEILMEKKAEKIAKEKEKKLKEKEAERLRKEKEEELKAEKKKKDELQLLADLKAKYEV